MLFNSYIFILLSIPFFFIIFISKSNQQRWLLLCFSYIFYAWAVPSHLFVLLYVSVTTLIGVKFITRINHIKFRKILFLLSLIAVSLPLLFYKYAAFALSQINFLLNLKVEALPLVVHEFALPVGISFFTFQALSLLIDSYRNSDKKSYAILEILLFISFFPQLVAGPIEKASHLIPQLKSVFSLNAENCINGVMLFFIGLFIKVVVADNLSHFVSNIFKNPSAYSGADVFLAVYFFGIQIFCDFSGYSIMAIGLALVLGVSLSVNFNNPYGSLSIREFWQRWHITLGTWFRDYVYVPLGGRHEFNLKYSILILFVFTLSGLWHGASWNFVVWGMLHACGYFIFMTISTPTKGVHSPLKFASLYVFSLLLTNVYVFCAWVFFRADDFTIATAIFSTISSIDFADFFTKEFWARAEDISDRVPTNFYFAVFAGIILHIRQLLFPNVSCFGR